MIRIFDTEPVAPVGADGSAVASATVGPINGEIVGIYVKYDSAQAATIDTNIATAHEPVKSILALTNSKTSGWYHPQAQLCDPSGTPLTFDGTHPIVDEICVSDYVTVSWAQADNTHPVRAYILVEQEG